VRRYSQPDKAGRFACGGSAGPETAERPGALPPRLPCDCGAWTPLECRTTIARVTDERSEIFTKLAPVLNVTDLVAERAFYERLGLPVIYEGDEYPDFIAFGTKTIDFGIQAASGHNDPPSVLTWQLGVSDVDVAADLCRAAGLDFTTEQNDPGPGWSYRRLILRSPSGYRVVLEGPPEQ